jgi:hypothetical protein
MAKVSLTEKIGTMKRKDENFLLKSNPNYSVKMRTNRFESLKEVHDYLDVVRIGYG